MKNHTLRDRGENWEKEFRDNFQITNDKYGRERFAKEINLPKKVKDFISSLLTAEREAHHSELDRVREEGKKQGLKSIATYIDNYSANNSGWTISDYVDFVNRIYALTQLAKDIK